MSIRSHLTTLLVCSSMSLTACGDNTAGADQQTVDAPAGDGSTFALAVIVFGPDQGSDMTYVSVFDSLDLTRVDLAHAYPFPGDADIATFDGKLYVSSGESPTITKYSLGAAGKLVDEGTISFANLGLTSANVHYNSFISSTKAYLAASAGQFVIWDPSQMAITGSLELPDLDRGPDLTLDGSIGVVRGNRMFTTLFWEDWSTYTFSTEQYLAVIDTDTDTLISKVAEQHCPNLGAAAQLDETGTIYFSNWFYNVPQTLMRGAAKSCAVRIPAGSETVDPTWSLTFADVDGGHEGSQLAYVGDGKAVFSAFREDAFPITGDTEPFDIPSATEWETWSVDLASTTAAAVTGVERGVAQQNVFHVGDRTFVLQPGADWAKTGAYEIQGDGSSRLAFTLDGWSRGFVQLR